MGIKINAQVNNKSDYVRNVRQFCKIFMQRNMAPIENLACLLPFTKNYQRWHSCIKNLHDYTNNVINNRRRELKNSKVKDESIRIKNKKPFLDLLLETTLSQEEIREEVDTFMFAVSSQLVLNNFLRIIV